MPIEGCITKIVLGTRCDTKKEDIRCFLLKNNFQNENYNLSESYESLEECLNAWRENREIEWTIELYFEAIDFED